MRQLSWIGRQGWIGAQISMAPTVHSAAEPATHAGTVLLRSHSHLWTKIDLFFFSPSMICLYVFFESDGRGTSLSQSNSKQDTG